MKMLWNNILNKLLVISYIVSEYGWNSTVPINTAHTELLKEIDKTLNTNLNTNMAKAVRTDALKHAVVSRVSKLTPCGSIVVPNNGEKRTYMIQMTHSWVQSCYRMVQYMRISPKIARMFCLSRFDKTYIVIAE